MILLITGEIKPNKSEVEVCTFRNYNQEAAEKSRPGSLECRHAGGFAVLAAITEAKDNGIHRIIYYDLRSQAVHFATR